ncbi:MAG TPA: 4-(cytidine 5'-diphospho)-2-C-methyl-D-erythritol kinase [Cytophagaceae bacterium]|jgi:4-diphosphocytidyl-2-C-methyl-D-erythritol kinase|nr:4-(cytidine 5'-diphospho)-2-C-methyl-D-erythritol kinase [Cytophagaceae bacterium]
MVSFPNAKINLGLNIVGKRADDYHNLESCFYSVPWQDALEILPSEKFQLTFSGIEIPGKHNDNLCVRVYTSLAKEFKLPPVQIHLHKNIPIGAGLGGGSSDAAFTIKTLNKLFRLNLSDETMEEYVKPLGSDCAFFINNKPVFAYDKGDRFEEININLRGKILVIIYPGIHISTKEAYNGIKPQRSAISIKEILLMDKRRWKDQLKNDFEMELFKIYPELDVIKNTLYQLGAFYASMSGSGSAIYGLFENEAIVSSVFSGSFPPEYKVMSAIL